MSNKIKKHPLSVVALKNKRTTGLLIIAFFCFNYPVLSFVNRPVMISGVPILYLYLFVLWIAVIGVSVVISSTTRDDSSVKTDQGEGI